MFEEETRKRSTYVYAGVGVLAVVVLITLLVSLWPASDTTEVYVGSCGDLHCDPLELSAASCAADCGAEEVKDEEVVTVEEEEPEEAEDVSGLEVLDTDFVGFDAETAEFSITIINEGDSAYDEEFTVEANLVYDGKEIDTCLKPIDDVPKGDLAEVTCYFVATDVIDELADGDVKVELAISFLDVEQSDSFTWSGGLVNPDLRVDSISFSVEDNSTLEITVSVQNEGSVDVDEAFFSDVALYVEDTKYDSCSSSSTEITEIAADDEESFSCDVDLDDVAELVLDGDVDIEIRVLVDEDDDVAEADEENNDKDKTGTLELSDFT